MLEIYSPLKGDIDMKSKKKSEAKELDRKVITNVVSTIDFDEMALLMFRLILESEGVNYYEEVRFTKPS